MERIKITPQGRLTLLFKHTQERFTAIMRDFADQYHEILNEVEFNASMNLRYLNENKEVKENGLSEGA